MKKLHNTHKEYILDVLEDEQNRLLNDISKNVSMEYQYKVNRLIEVTIEINELSK